jgi:transcriptional regulator with XRE-family HTH domain
MLNILAGTGLCDVALSLDLGGFPMDSRDSLAAVLRVLRRARKLKAEHFSAGINPTHVANLENGNVSVTIETLEAVANVLNVKPISLLVLATGLRTSLSADDVIQEVRSEIERLYELGLVGEFVNEFEDGYLKSRPSGAQVALGRLEAVRRCKASGMTQKQTAQELGVPTSTVQRDWQKV